MSNHITEAVWFNARKQLPNSDRDVVVVFKYLKGQTFIKRIATAKYSMSIGWVVDSKCFSPSTDIVTQWAEVSNKRGGFMPDDFPVYDGYEFISNSIER